MTVRIGAKTTAVFGRELVLEVQLTNQHRSCTIRSWIVDPAGVVEPLDGPLEWTDSIFLGQTLTRSTRVRVLSRDPFELIGKMRAADAPRWGLLDPEMVLRLYPFELQDGAVVVSWNEKTGLPRGQESPAVVRGPDNEAFRLLSPLPGPTIVQAR